MDGVLDEQISDLVTLKTTYFTTAFSVGPASKLAVVNRQRKAAADLYLGEVRKVQDLQERIKGVATFFADYISDSSFTYEFTNDDLKKSPIFQDIIKLAETYAERYAAEPEYFDPPSDEAPFILRPGKLWCPGRGGIEILEVTATYQNGGVKEILVRWFDQDHVSEEKYAYRCSAKTPDGKHPMCQYGLHALPYYSCSSSEGITSGYCRNLVGLAGHGSCQWIP